MTDKVLLVDDEEDFVETLADRLRARGLDVETAHSGEAGLEKVAGESFDAVVLDYAMPGLNGLDTLKQMVEGKPDLQVMLLTGHATIKTAVEASRLGAVDVLEKPTDIETLLERIREARATRLATEEQRSREEIAGIMRNKGW